MRSARIIVDDNSTTLILVVGGALFATLSERVAPRHGDAHGLRRRCSRFRHSSPRIAAG